MKKTIIFLFILSLITACSNKEEVNNKTSNKEEKKEEEIVTVPTYIDDNPIKLGLYMNGKLIRDYNTKFVNATDIASFDVYYTNTEDVGSTNTKNNFNKYYSNYENIDKYKIGYFISFDADNKHYEKTILDSDNEFTFYPFIYLYLYDDIHQTDGSWYSHVTKDEENENTIFSSIKLYLGGESEKMDGEIILTAFTYDSEDDFDENGYYRGNSSYTISINNK